MHALAWVPSEAKSEMRLICIQKVYLGRDGRNWREGNKKRLMPNLVTRWCSQCDLDLVTTTHSTSLLLGPAGGS